MQTTDRENVIIYLDIKSDIIKRKDITKALVNFVKNRVKINPLTDFGLLIFKEGGIPDFIIVKNGIDEIIRKLEEDWKIRDTSENYLENGLFYCLSHVAESASRHACKSDVIVISDFPSGKSEEYTSALLDLVDKVRNFPTYIHIIRVGSRKFYEDDIKLKLITDRSGGRLLFASNRKQLDAALLSLLRTGASNGTDVKDTNRETELFFMRLAADPIYLEPSAGIPCYFCGKEIYTGDDTEYGDLVQCRGCGTVFHIGELGRYAYDNNIGFIHIFRCPKCEALMKLDKFLVMEINGIKESDLEEVPIEFTEINKEDENVNMEVTDGNGSGPETPQPSDVGSVSPERNVSAVDIAANRETPSSGEIDREEKEKSFIPLTPSGASFFGRSFFGAPAIVGRADNGDSSEYTLQSANGGLADDSPEYKPVSSRPNGVRKKRGRPSIILCPVCGASVRSGDKVCKSCGAPLR